MTENAVNLDFKIYLTKALTRVVKNYTNIEPVKKCDENYFRRQMTMLPALQNTAVWYL